MLDRHILNNPLTDFDLLVIKIIHDDQRGIKWPFHAVIVGHKAHPDLSGVML